jgi:LytS/YehU family sensor histidine kinase
VLFSSVYPQERVDSLTKSLAVITNDTDKVNTINKIAFLLAPSDPSKATGLAERAIRMSDSMSWPKGTIDAYEVMGYLYESQGKYELALDYWNKVLDARKKSDQQEPLCTVIGNIGTVYYQQSDYAKALQYYLEALKIGEKIGNKEKICSNTVNIAAIYKEQKNYAKALEYLFRALKITEKANNPDQLAQVYGSIASVCWRKVDYREAIDYYSKAIKTSELAGNKGNVAAWLCNAGGVYASLADSAKAKNNSKLQMEFISKALENTVKALAIMEETENIGGQAIALGNVGSMYTQLKKYDQAEAYLQRSLGMALKYHIPNLEMDVHESLSVLYQETGKFEKALEEYKLYTGIKDSIYNDNNSKVISELQVKYDTEKKEAENNDLLKKNELQALTIRSNRYLFAGLLSLLLIVVLAAWLVIRQNRLKAAQQAVYLEQRLLRTQMNPHFIFNSLASIETFIYDHQPKEAGVYLSSFARLMRLILENSSSDMITLEKELEILNYYLSLQKLRMDGNLEYSIDVAPNIHPDEISLPPMLLQPFLENAIEHGFRGNKETGRIKVSFVLEKESLEIHVTDNGIGISTAQQQKNDHNTHRSMAMQITLERLAYLNKNKKHKLFFTVADLRNEEKGITGTTVFFSVPLQ